MSADGPLFWMLMGMMAVLTGGALWSFAGRRGWAMPWWKWVLAVLWYALVRVLARRRGDAPSPAGGTGEA